MKIKPPKQYYTVSQLAERWECKVEDVEHLIDIGELKTTPYLAALHGKKDIRIQVTRDPAIWADACDKANTGENYDAVRLWDRPLSKGEYIQHVLNEWMDQGPINVSAEDLASEIDDEEFDEAPQTIGDAADRFLKELHDDGSYDPVITAAEVSRFEREHGEPTNDAAPPSSWPWGDYETPLLRILADAVTHFCLDGAERYPKKDCGAVVDWIKQQMEANGMPSSDQLAGAIETLIAPRPYVHHRQRKQVKP